MAQLSNQKKAIIFARDRFTCLTCHKKFQPPWEIENPSEYLKNGGNFLVPDHIDPEKGNDESNLQTLCFRCNSKKGARSGRVFSLVTALTRFGRPISFYPSIAKIIGLKETLFLCQLLYWTPRSRNYRGEGWVFKDSTEIEDETGLTYKEQVRIRKGLRAIGVLEEQYNRQEHTIYFRVDPTALDLLFDEFLSPGGHLTDGQMPGGEHLTFGQVPPDQKADGTVPKVSSYKEPETTTEITQLKKGDPFVLPNWIDPQTWRAFEEMRRTIKKPMTEWAKILMVKKLATLKAKGYAPKALLERSILNCWQDVFEPREPAERPHPPRVHRDPLEMSDAEKALYAKFEKASTEQQSKRPEA